MDAQVLEKFGRSKDRRIMLVAASPIEARAILAGLHRTDILTPPPWASVAVGRFDLLLTGISKANAAGAVALRLDPDRHAAVLSLGIAGSYPAASPLEPPLGAAIIASASIMADEGVRTPGAFIDCAALGFPLGDFPGSSIAPDDELFQLLTPLADAAGAIATVSTCSGTDQLASELQARTGAIAEGMEGAAIGLAAHRLGVAFAEIRTISNTTGDRASQAWNITLALTRLSDVAARL